MIVCRRPEPVRDCGDTGCPVERKLERSVGIRIIEGRFVRIKDEPVEGPAGTCSTATFRSAASSATVSASSAITSTSRLRSAVTCVFTSGTTRSQFGRIGPTRAVVLGSVHDHAVVWHELFQHERPRFKCGRLEFVAREARARHDFGRPRWSSLREVRMFPEASSKRTVRPSGAVMATIGPSSLL